MYLDSFLILDVPKLLGKSMLSLLEVRHDSGISLFDILFQLKPHQFFSEKSLNDDGTVSEL